MRPEALQALRGVAHVLHAGDVGGAHVLEALRAIAPLTAVRGNNDDASLGLAERELVELGGVRIELVHQARDVLAAPGTRLVVVGHSHRPSIEERDGALWINPGSAGPRRFSLPITIARIEIARREIVAARIVTLDVAPPRSRAHP